MYDLRQNCLNTIMSSYYKYLVQHFPVSEHFSLQQNVHYHIYLQQHQRLLLSLFLLVLDQQVLQRHDHINIIFCFLQVRLYDPKESSFFLILEVNLGMIKYKLL